MDSKEKTTEQLLEERTQDLAFAKLRMRDRERHSFRMTVFAVIMAVLVLACLVCFAASIYFIAREQTNQIRAIFDSDFSFAHEFSGEHIEQDSGNGNAIITNRSAITNSTVTVSNKDR